NRDGMPSSRITEINKEEANDTTLVERPAPRRRLSDCGGIATWRLSGCMGAATATAPSAGASPRAARLDRGAGTGDGWSARRQPESNEIRGRTQHGLPDRLCHRPWTVPDRPAA